MGATWPARPDRAPRTEQESTLSLQANPGPPAAPHCPGSSTVPAAVRAHSPAAPLPAAGSEQYQLRCGCSADGCASSGRTRVVSPSAARRGAAQLAEAFRAERAARALAEDGANHTFARQGGIKGGVLGACPAPRTLWVSRGSARPGLGSGWHAGWSASGLLLPTSREQEGSVVWLTGIHSYIVSSRASSPPLVPVGAGAPAAAVGAPPPPRGAGSGRSPARERAHLESGLPAGVGCLMSDLDFPD